MPKKSRRRRVKSPKRIFEGKGKESRRAIYEETYNIVVAIFVSALILAYDPQNPPSTFGELPGAVFASLIAFSLPLLVQKMVARKLGCLAFYKLWLPGIIVSMLLMLVGIKPVVLVGAVALSAYKFGRWGFESRYRTMTEIGWVGVSGLLVNIAVASIIMLFTPFTYLAFVNGVFAFFNMMPVRPLDGSKVMFWDPVLWILLMVIIILILTPSGILTYLPAIQGA